MTVCVKDRVCLFGNVINGQMQLNHAGRIVADAWNDLPNHYADVTLDAFVVMPNHVHGVIILTDPIGAGFKPAPMITTPTLKPAPTTTSSSYTNDKPRPYAMVCRKSYADLKRFPPAALMNIVVRRVSPSGNAIITNISFAMMNP